MKAIINMNSTALEHFPEEDFSKVQIGKRKVKTGSEVEISDEEYATLVKASYSHPDNGLPVKYFSIKVITLADNSPMSQLSEAIKSHTNLYAAIYLTLANTDQLKETSIDLDSAASVIYRNLQNNLQEKQENDDE